MKTCLTLTVFSAIFNLPVQAQDQAAVDMAKKIYEERQAAVVAVTAVVKLQMSVSGGGNQTQEQSVEMLGTVVNEQGLTVVTYSGLDVSSQVRSQVKGKLPPGVKLDIKADFKEVKLITSDGDEIPADVIMKDPELDLAFIRPDPTTDEFKNTKFSPIKLTPPPVEPVLLDEVILIERTGKDLNRRATVNFARIVGVQTKPRTFYLVNDQNGGTPVFDLKGNLVGIFARRVFEGAATSPIILPVKDVAEIAKQAEAAKAPEKPKDGGAKEPDKVEEKAPEDKPKVNKPKEEKPESAPAPPAKPE